jgi:hypothetical protein
LTEKLDTREDAALVLNDIENFEFVALLFFSDVIKDSAAIKSRKVQF